MKLRLPNRKGTMRAQIHRRRRMARADRLVWPFVSRTTRAVMILNRAQLWTYHPAAIAVERSAMLRLGLMTTRGRAEP